MLQVITDIDNSSDSFLSTNTKTRYVNFPGQISCGENYPTFGECTNCSPYSHPFESNSVLPIQFALGSYNYTDVTAAKVQLIDESQAVIKESDFIALTNNIDIVSTTITEIEGLRLTINFRPSNFTNQVFYVRGLFTIDGVDLEFTSQAYCRARCEDLLMISSEYRDNALDCLGAYYDGTYVNNIYLNTDIELSEFEMNDVAYNSQGQKTYAKNWDAYTIKAVLNETAAKHLKAVLQGTNIMVNGKSYFNTALFEKNNTSSGLWIVEVTLYQQCESDIKRC